MEWEVILKWLPKLMQGATLTLELTAISVIAGDSGHGIGLTPASPGTTTVAASGCWRCHAVTSTCTAVVRAAMAPASSGCSRVAPRSVASCAAAACKDDVSTASPEAASAAWSRVPACTNSSWRTSATSSCI